MRILVYGTGMELSHVLGLVEAGHDVVYYTDYIAPYPAFEDFVAGLGFKTIKKVHDFFNYVDSVDMVATFDCYGGDVFEYLRRHGKKVFGGGMATELELDRKLLKSVLKSVKIPTPSYKIVKGIDDVEPPAVVKLSIFRGSAETFIIKNEAEKKNMEVRLLKEFGEFLSQIEFIVEEVIENDNLVEAGVDAVYDNGFVFPMLVGVEYRKGVYIGRVINSLTELPKAFQDTISKLDLVLRRLNYRGFLSTEEFINPRTGEHYFLDITIRSPYPLGLGYRYAMKNFADVITKSAKPEFKDKWYVAVPIHFSQSKEYFTYVKFPEKDKRYNFNNLGKLGKHYYIPKGEDYSGCVCEVFSELNLEKIKTTMEELLSQVEGVGISDSLSDLEPAYEEVRKLWQRL